tara:strand:- start:3903 stop:4223 length:321 start_codon:yes stop_codon:yes gene_type:complete
MNSGQLALGAYVALADPQIVEIIGISGFDAVFIDMEHTAFDLSLVQQMIVAADLVDITPIVRVSDSDPGFILRVLDMGAQGILFHMLMVWKEQKERWMQSNTLQLD